MFDSATSASTSSVSMSAIVTTAPLLSDADENGVMLSPTFACFASTMPSNGARITVWSTATCAACALASADAIAAWSLLSVARALFTRAVSVSSCAAGTAPGRERGRAAQRDFRILQFRLRDAEVRAGHLNLRARLRERCSHVVAFEPRDDLVLLHARAFEHAEPFDAPWPFDATAALRCGTT